MIRPYIGLHLQCVILGYPPTQHMQQYDFTVH